MRTLSKSDLRWLYFRSFLVQTGFTYDRLLAFGFAWALIPLTKRLLSSAEERKIFLKRHLLSFNANPYLAAYALGAVAKLEEQKTLPQQICRFKELMRGPLGALGDNLIWQNLRPALLILGVILASVLGVYGVLIVWFIFNLYQFYLRSRGILKGYALGWNVSSDLGQEHLQSMIKWSSRMGAGLLGMIFILSLAAGGKFSELGGVRLDPKEIGILLLFCFISILAFRRNISPSYVLPILMILFFFLKPVFGIV